MSEPEPCKRLLAGYKTSNDPVREFADEFLPELAWDLVPNKFLLDLYIAWMKRYYPGTKPLGRNGFLEGFRELLPEYPDWVGPDKEYVSSGRMTKPELLIEEYELKNWYNSSYQGPDPNKRCTIQPKIKYRGFLRAPAGSVAGPGGDDK